MFRRTELNPSPKPKAWCSNWPKAPRLETVIRLCTTGTIGDGIHLLFEYPELKTVVTSELAYYKA